LVRKNFGGRDLDNIFYKLQNKKHSALFKKKGMKVKLAKIKNKKIYF
jgi:hypothetical protein